MEVEISNMKEVEIHDLNHCVKIRSSFENESLESLVNIALNVLDHIKVKE